MRREELPLTLTCNVKNQIGVGESSQIAFVGNSDDRCSLTSHARLATRGRPQFLRDKREDVIKECIRSVREDLE